MPRTEAVSTITPTAPSADRVGRMVITSGRPIVGGRADRFEPTPTFIQRRSEMKVFMVRRHSSGPRRRRKSLSRDGTGAETLGWEYLARHKPARRPQLPERRHDKPALRVAVRIRPLRHLEGSLGAGPELGN
jgi:hypothetical protein